MWQEWETRNAYRISVGKPEGKRPRRRWVDNIKIDLRERGRDSVDWIDLAQDRDQWEVPEWLHNWLLLRKGSAP
jgi:hypothetical protein